MRDPSQLRRPGAAGARAREDDQARLTPLYTESPADAALDVALSHALLRDTAAGRPAAVRVWSPPPAVSLGRLDLLADEPARAAAAAARAAGFAPVRRLAGGRAAAVGPGTACLGWASPSAPLAGTQDRYELLAEVVLDALGRLGIHGRTGELAGEWCPGTWSVLAGGVKVGGLAQRMIRGGAWAEAVVVVSEADALRRALDPVQRALGVDWRPETLAGLEGVTVEQVRDALAAAAGVRWDLVPAPVPPELWSRARALRAEHALCD